MSKKSQEREKQSLAQAQANRPAPTNGLDYSLALKLSEIKEMPFPCPESGEFRVHVKKRVYDNILAHGNEDKKVELCGVLVGSVCKDPMGPFLLIEESIRGVGTKNDGAQVTFTHETWAHIHNQMESNFKNFRIVGWYHTHPGFGIFLSEMDKFIHDYFFNQVFQVAMVIDPIAGREGIFYWKDGLIQSLPRCWIGDSIKPLTSGYVGNDSKIAGNPKLNSKTFENQKEQVSSNSEDASLTAKFFNLPFLAMLLTFLLGTAFTAFYLRHQIKDAYRESARAEIKEVLTALLGSVAEQKSFEVIEHELSRLENSFRSLGNADSMHQRLALWATVRQQLEDHARTAVSFASTSLSIQNCSATSQNELLELEKLLASFSAEASSTGSILDFPEIFQKIKFSQESFSRIASFSEGLTHRLASTDSTFSVIDSQIASITQMGETSQGGNSQKDILKQIKESRELVINLASASYLREKKLRDLLSSKAADALTVNERISRINEDFSKLRQIIAWSYYLQVKNLMENKSQGLPDQDIVKQAQQLMVFAISLEPAIENQFRRDCPVLFQNSLKGAGQ